MNEDGMIEKSPSSFNQGYIMTLSPTPLKTNSKEFWQNIVFITGKPISREQYGFGVSVILAIGTVLVAAAPSVTFATIIHIMMIVGIVNIAELRAIVLKINRLWAWTIIIGSMYPVVAVIPLLFFCLARRASDGKITLLNRK
jgi:hypothetical protein